jgi:uncharacterized membrane-anchored protein
MRNILFGITAVLVLGTMNFLIVQKERILANGQIVFIKLAPVDPRSLMQGDYMSLRYASDTFPDERDAPASDTWIVLKLDANRVGTFKRFYDGYPPSRNEVLIRYRSGDGIHIGQYSFFIQEGTGGIYSKARYAEMRIDRHGDGIVVGLRDDQFALLGPGRK